MAKRRSSPTQTRLLVVLALVLVAVLAAFFWNWLHLDLVVFSRTRAISVGGHPWAIAPGRGSERLFVSDNNPDGVSGRLLEIDPGTGRLIKEIRVGPGRPKHVAVSQDGTRVFVPISTRISPRRFQGTSRVVVLEVESGSASTLPVAGRDLCGIAVSPDGQTLYVTDGYENAISIVSSTTGAVAARVSARGRPFDIALTSDGARAYVPTLHKRSDVLVLDTASGGIAAEIPIELASGPLDAFVTLAPNGERLYVTYAGSGRIAVVDTHPRSPTFHQQIDSIATSSEGLSEMAFHPTEPFAAVIAREEQRLLVIETRSMNPRFHAVVHGESIGQKGVALAFAGDGRGVRAYVTNYGDGTIQVFEKSD